MTRRRRPRWTHRVNGVPANVTGGICGLTPRYSLPHPSMYCTNIIFNVHACTKNLSALPFYVTAIIIITIELPFDEHYHLYLCIGGLVDARTYIKHNRGRRRRPSRRVPLMCWDIVFAKIKPQITAGLYRATYYRAQYIRTGRRVD